MHECNVEVEDEEYYYVPINLRNHSTVSPQNILLNFKEGEIQFGNVLKSLAQMRHLEQLQKYYLDPDELLGRIDIIDRYHRHSFLPSLLSAETPNDLIEVFLEHKCLFHYYEDTMRRDVLLKCLKDEIKELDAFYKDNKSLITHKLEEYVNVLEQLTFATNVNSQRCDIIKQMLIDVCINGHCNAKRDRPVAELVVTDIRYLRTMEMWLKCFDENIFASSNKFYAFAEQIYGKLPSIFAQQKQFLLNLEEYLYDFDIVNIMDCFLEHAKVFRLYVEDRKVKRTSTLENCKREYPVIKNMPDITLDRIFKYVQFMERFHKVYNGDKVSQKKIKEVHDFFEGIIGDANNSLAIMEIIETNISVNEQGPFLWRQTVKVSSHIPALAEVNKKDCMVFLFEKCVIFTKMNPDKKYLYIYHVLTSGISYRKENANDIIISRGILRNETFKLVVQDEKTPKLILFEEAIQGVLERQLNNIRKSLDGNKTQSKV